LFSKFYVKGPIQPNVPFASSFFIDSAREFVKISFDS